MEGETKGENSTSIKYTHFFLSFIKQSFVALCGSFLFRNHLYGLKLQFQFTSQVLSNTNMIPIPCVSKHILPVQSALWIFSNDLSLLKTCGLQLFANYYLERGRGVQYTHFASFERSALRSTRMLCKKYFKIERHGPRIQKKRMTM